MQKTMKEVILFEKQDLRLVDSPVPKCGPNDALIKIRACAICPTDLRKYALGKMGSPLIHLPMNMGHEWAGDVIEVGENVKNYPKVGMLVRGVAGRGYGEYTLAPVPAVMTGPPGAGFSATPIDEMLVQMADNVSYEEATFVENIMICTQAVVDQAGARVGKTIVIIGAGQMGLTQVMIGKLSGAKVIVTEFLDWRRELAQKYGADYVIDASKEDPAKEVEKITKGKMADGCVVTVGQPDAIVQGLKVVGPGGVVCIFGGSTLDTTVTFNPNLIHYGSRILTGVGVGGQRKGKMAMELIASGKIPVKGLYSHTFKLEELPEAFKKITEGKLERYLKGMIIP
ncbi:MAG: hypothetical protein QG670_2280 [Thermoproteota archaeon]|nr:hypothetical protein [Thermoproteota archaeon]